MQFCQHKIKASNFGSNPNVFAISSNVLNNYKRTSLTVIPLIGNRLKPRQYKIPEAQFSMAKILILHGPNLNLLGTREPNFYGEKSLSDINSDLIQQGLTLGHEVICFQSNGENVLIDRIHQAKTENIAFIIINLAGYTHTSVALRDALLAVSIPFIEVHLSNIFKREQFRQISYFSDIAEGIIMGLGPYGYRAAIEAAHHLLFLE